MFLLIPLIATTLVLRMLAGLLLRRGVQRAQPWASWSAAAAAGMGVVFIITGFTHFIEPQRSGLVAIVPGFIPMPELVITLTGIAELVLAIGLIVPRTRERAGAAAVVLLLALLPANVIAAGGVDNPAAPNTPLVPRLLLQAAFIGFAAAPLLARLRRRARLSRAPRASSFAG